jgi:hypothetical protein
MTPMVMWSRSAATGLELNSNNAPQALNAPAILKTIEAMGCLLIQYARVICKGLGYN